MRATRIGTLLTACCGLLIAIGAAPVAAAATAPGATAPAVTANARVIPDTCTQALAKARQLTSKTHVTVACVQPASGTSASSVTPDQSSICGIDQWAYDRFDACMVMPGTFYLYTVDPETGGTVVIGVLNFDLTQDISLSAVTSTFTENDQLVVTSASGDAAAGTSFAFTVTCGGTCKATNYFHGSPLGPGSDITGSVAYSDSTTSVDSTSSRYTLAFDNPEGDNGPVSVTWSSQPYRCDDEVAAYAGCVVPAYIPTMTSMSTLPNIAANIASIQAAGPHHYGNSSYSPGYPLHRTTNPTIMNANNNTACPPSGRPVRQTPEVGPPPSSCDEYPFGSTYEGASRTTKPDWGTAMVPVAQQNSQGGLISSFYQAQRLLDGDAFWVSV